MASEIREAQEIHEEVREYYAAKAMSGGSCCGPQTDGACCGATTSPLYNADEIALVPAEAATLSLGCGNPTALASLRAGEVVVDLGSGGGLDVLLAARQVGPKGYVYGIDMTDEMLDRARRNAAKQGAINVEFRRGQIEDIPLPDQTADVIISNCVINLSPDKGQTLSEAFRVLRPGGRLAVSDVVLDGDWTDLPVSEGQVRQALSWAGCIAGALTMRQYAELLSAAGFEEIELNVQHRSQLEDTGLEDEAILELMPLQTARELVSRFVSCAISARRPR